MANIDFEKFTLSNGLDVIFHHDHSIPVVSVNVWYHVGSKNEEAGRTGFAHLFEHLMFEGSKHHNRSHFEPLQKIGANLNGSTTTDRTNYWENLPSNYLELALWLEADRMGFLLDALDQQRFDIQREVVKNERRQSYENRPYGMVNGYLQEALFPLPHPYNWMTIGSQEDLNAASLEDVKNFFHRFYAPSNCSLAIAGDFDRNQAMELITRYFGNLPPGPTIQRTERFDSPLAGRVELNIRDQVLLPRLYLAWPTQPELHHDDAPLEVLQSILADGLSSRLHKSLVYEKQIAQDVQILYYPAEIAGQFIVIVTAAANHELSEIEEATETELNRIQHNPPSDEELCRAKNRLEASHYQQLARVGGFGGRADQLNHFNVLAGNPNLINTCIKDLLSVDVPDILRVHSTVLNDRQVRLRVYPTSSLRPTVVNLDRSIIPGPANEPLFVPPSPVRRRLNNGLQVIVAEKRGLPIVAMALLLQTGAVRDPIELPGLAALTTAMLPESTQSRSSQEIAQAFEFIGSNLSNNTHREFTLLSTETLSKSWPTALELMADIVQHPTFPEYEFERVRKEHLTNLQSGEDDPNFVAQQIIPGLVFGRSSGYGHPILGTEEAVKHLSCEDIHKQYLSFFSPQAATLIVAGDVGIDEVMERVEAEYGSWSVLPSLSTNEAPSTHAQLSSTSIHLVDKPDAAQSVIYVAHPTVSRHHPDYFGLTLLNQSFGGQFSARLNQNLRQDKGYSYGFNSSIQWHKGPSLLLAGGSVQTAVTKESIEETLQEFKDIHSSRPLSQEELDSAKAALLLGYPATFERPDQLVRHLIQCVVYDLPDDYLNTVTDHFSTISLKEIHRIGIENIRPDELKILVVGDLQLIRPRLESLGLPVFLLDRKGSELVSNKFA